MISNVCVSLEINKDCILNNFITSRLQSVESVKISNYDVTSATIFRLENVRECKFSSTLTKNMHWIPLV